MRYLFAVSVAMSSFIASYAHAQDEHNGACKTLRAACEAAGFKLGEHKNEKGIVRDCMQPLLSGKTVAGVTASAADIDACKTKREKRKKNK